MLRVRAALQFDIRRGHTPQLIKGPELLHRRFRNAGVVVAVKQPHPTVDEIVWVIDHSLCVCTNGLSCRLAAAGASGNCQPACSKSLRPKWVQTASEATTRRGTSVRTKGFPNGGVMLSTWAAQPKGPPATIPAPFTRLEKAIWNWWAKNAPEDMPETVTPAGSSLANGRGEDAVVDLLGGELLAQVLLHLGGVSDHYRLHHLVGFVPRPRLGSNLLAGHCSAPLPSLTSARAD